MTAGYDVRNDLLLRGQSTRRGRGSFGVGFFFASHRGFFLVFCRLLVEEMELENLYHSIGSLCKAERGLGQCCKAPSGDTFVCVKDLCIIKTRY